jgi:arylsulfatase A
MMHDHLEVCGGKGLTNDRGTHVPLICSQPNTIPSGVVSGDLVDMSDYFPTIMEAAGVDLPANYNAVDGVSFLPQLRGEEGNPRDWMFFHFPHNTARRVSGMESHIEDASYTRFMRGHRWKLYEDGRMYDLNDDPEEEIVFLAHGDDDERAAARAALQPVFARLVAEPGDPNYVG